MRSARGLYSLIQYRPDESRLESINIGVVLFSAEPKHVLAKWAESARTRIRRVFGDKEWHVIENEVNAVKQRLSNAGDIASSDDFVRYAATRANSIVLTVPRFVKVQGDPVALVDALFDRLVGESPRIRRAAHVTRKFTRVLDEHGLLPYVRQNVEIAIPKLNKTLKASYGYQNGRFNLIQPEQFGLSNEDQVFQKASRLAVEGKFIYDEQDSNLGRMQLVVVGQFRSDQEESRSLVTEIFQKHQVGIYGFDAIDPLLRDIEQNARKNGLDGLLGVDGTTG
jgi:hypothetical protein